MDNKKLLEIFEKQLKGEYFTASELQYSNKAGLYLSPFEYKQYLEFKDGLVVSGHESIISLPLESFNSKPLHFCLGSDLLSSIDSCRELASLDQSAFDRFSTSFLNSRIYSEIEGSLNVESIPTARRRLKELLENNAPAQNTNDIVIKNMKAGIDFVHGLPEFTKENLFHLYCLLSKECLDEEDKLKPGDLYRYDDVQIGHYYGCPPHLISACMDSLFAFVADVLNNRGRDDVLLNALPHICHYYLLYIHPYFDFNGRTARMVSYWVYLLSGSSLFPPIVSEAINQTKNKYYQAIEQTKDTHNDLTYFLKYLFAVMGDYIICYQNLNSIEEQAKGKGQPLTETELNYAKRILISYHGPFDYSDFLKMAMVEMSKQGALKILNKFIDLGFLKEFEAKTKAKLFDINPNCLPFSLKHFGYKKVR